MTLDRSWLERTTEPTLEPQLPICDPHHHLWDQRDVPHWRDNRYLFDELRVDLNSGHNIRATVYIECASMYRTEGPTAFRPVGETEFANGVAAMSASGQYGETRVCAGIVGFADLTLGEAVKPVLEAHIQAGGGRFRGIRHAVSWDESAQIRNSLSEPPARLLDNRDYRRGFEELAPLGLTFEAWLYHPQLPDLIRLATAYPETTIILNHFGGPLRIGPYAARKDDVFKSWQDDIAALSQCPNVVAKLGGLQMDINGFAWHERELPPTSEQLAQATAPFHLHTLEQFGVERCFFESNFPVDNLSCSYNVLWNSFKRITAHLSKQDRACLFHDNATRIYRL